MRLFLCIDILPARVPLTHATITKCNGKLVLFIGFGQCSIQRNIEGYSKKYNGKCIINDFCGMYKKNGYPKKYNGKCLRTAFGGMYKMGYSKKNTSRAQELCESRGGRPRHPVPYSRYGLCGRKIAMNKIQRETSNTAFGGMYKTLCPKKYNGKLVMTGFGDMYKKIKK